MNCTESKALLKYLEDQLSPLENDAMEAHLLTCPSCRSIAELYREDEQMMRAVLGAYRLDDQFTRDVMARLSGVEMEEAPQPPMQAAATLPLTGRRRNGKRAAVAVAATAALLVFGVSFGASVSPAFASYLRSIFQSSAWDEGVRQAAGQGYAQGTRLEATDHGITFRVLDIFADQSRIYVAYEAKDEQGNLLDPELQTKRGPNRAVLTDEQGNVLSEASGWKRLNETAVLTFPVPEGSREKVWLSLELQELGGRQGSAEQGEWKLHAEVDLKKSLEAMRKFAIGKQIDLPGGISVRLNQVRVHPSSFEVQVEAKGGEGAQTVPTFEYRLLDQDGNVLGGYPLGPNLVGLTDQGAAFVPAGDLESVRFVLDAVETQEPSSLVLYFDLENGDGKPITQAAGDCTFTMKSFGLDEKQANKKGQVPYVLNLAATVPETVKAVLWEAVDEEGNRYQVGGSTEQLDAQDGKRRLEQQLIVSGLDRLPKKLTLKAERVIKRYEGKLWEETIQLK